MRLALAQLNPTVGDVAGNTRLLLEAIDRAREQGADLLVATELGLIGYPPRDLLFREGVVEACDRAVRRVARYAGDLAVIVGHPRRGRGGTRPLRNSVSVCAAGKVLAVYDKRLLPGYDIFDEDRYFDPGDVPCVIEVAGCRVGLLICEDLWRAQDVRTERTYAIDPVRETAALGCDLLVASNANPFVMGKWQRHLEQLRAAATGHRLPVVAVQQVGGNDDLIFDGRSVAVDADGSIVTVLPGWESAVETIELPRLARGSAGPGPARPQVVAAEFEPMSELFGALVLGVKDYCGKTGNEKVIIGLSGGIDSAVTACIAVRALGPDRVLGVMMPSRYSSAASLEDAVELAAKLSLPRCHTVPIESVHLAVQDSLAASLREQAGGVTDENIQARLRGILLMAFANAKGGLVLATSNKSEVATGYCTIYGDMCGALSVLADVAKTRVNTLAGWINTHHLECGFPRPPIPRRTMTRPPTAELRPNQLDQDTLPPYEILDPIVERYIEREQSGQQIIDETELDPELVRETVAMIDRAQYKRDQAALILKVTARTFGRGRPMPIAMRWEEAGVEGQVSGEENRESASGARRLRVGQK
ncbi:MAG: NAD+ synthase [Planctomycetota bacterium]|jgi:NAD+ synthetase